VLGKQLLPEIWKKHVVAGIVLESQSDGGEQTIYSTVMSGNTSLYGYPVGFFTKISATKSHVVLDIVFDADRTKGALPDNARFELDMNGTMTVGELPADALEIVQKEVALRKMPCPKVLAMIALGAHL
jgi:hypothetical protein